MNPDLEYIVEQVKAVLAIDSPTGYTKHAADYVLGEYRRLGYQPQLTGKGGVLVCLNPEAPAADGVLLMAHMDTLGGMVAEICGSGRLRLTNLGGMNPNNAEAENVRVVTRTGSVYTGTCQLKNASVHVNGEYSSTKRGWDTMEVVLDEEVCTKEDVEALGILPGDVVCFDPRTTVTPSGYLKSRFLDDKLSVAILLGQAKRAAEGKTRLRCRVWHHITAFEEVGHGGASSVPEGVAEAISVDMG